MPHVIRLALFFLSSVNKAGFGKTQSHPRSSPRWGNGRSRAQRFSSRWGNDRSRAQWEKNLTCLASWVASPRSSSQRYLRRYERHTSRHWPAVTRPRVERYTRGRTNDSQSLNLCMGFKQPSRTILAMDFLQTENCVVHFAKHSILTCIFRTLQLHTVLSTFRVNRNPEAAQGTSEN